jgi:hypothetical protein
MNPMRSSRSFMALVPKTTKIFWTNMTITV